MQKPAVTLLFHNEQPGSDHRLSLLVSTPLVFYRFACLTRTTSAGLVQ